MNAVASWGGGASYPDAMLQQWLGRDIRAMSLEEYVFWAGLVQGEGLREYCDNFRRRAFSSAAAIFWMYNDTWPAVRSWTIVDYYNRRTPAFWPVRRALAPLSVVVAQQGDDVTVWGINETSETVRGELRYGVFHLAGDYPLEHAQSVELPPRNSTPLASFPMSDWRRHDADGTTSAAFATLERGGELLARNRLLLPFWKEMQWPEAAVQVRVENGRAVFRSETFAWGVCLDLDGETALPDNFFDLFPGREYSLPWSAVAPPQVLRVGNLVC